MFLSGLGLLSSTLASHVAVRICGIELQQQHKITWNFYFTRVLPVGIAQAATLALGNAVYLYLTVSFIQMLKAFTPVMVVIVAVVFGIETADTKVSPLTLWGNVHRYISMSFSWETLAPTVI